MAAPVAPRRCGPVSWRWSTSRLWPAESQRRVHQSGHLCHRQRVQAMPRVSMILRPAITRGRAVRICFMPQTVTIFAPAGHACGTKFDQRSCRPARHAGHYPRVRLCRQRRSQRSVQCHHPNFFIDQFECGFIEVDARQHIAVAQCHARQRHDCFPRPKHRDGEPEFRGFQSGGGNLLRQRLVHQSDQRGGARPAVCVASLPAVGCLADQRLYFQRTGWRSICRDQTKLFVDQHGDGFTELEC